MSNRAVIQPTKFVSVNDGVDGTTYGVRVWDDNYQTYDNTWDEIPEDDMDILRKVNESGDVAICEILNDIENNHKGVYIGSNWYTWKQIKGTIQ